MARADSLGSEVRDSFWLFPLVETVHLFGIVVLVGATSTLDLRLLGLAMKSEPVSKLARQMLGWTWTAFGVMVITGFLMFASEATRCWENTAFRLKMAMLLLAGLNALIFTLRATGGCSSGTRCSTRPLEPRSRACFRFFCGLELSPRGGGSRSFSGLLKHAFNLSLRGAQRRRISPERAHDRLRDSSLRSE